MKKLGLIGGTGPESTILYYKGIEQGVKREVGKPYFPPMTIESLSVFEVLSFCGKKDYDGLAEYLLSGFRNLASAGCDFVALTGITPHVVIDRLKEKSPIPVVSMLDAAAEETKRRGFLRVGLLGTYPTMTGTFFQEAFRKQGITVVCPHEEEMRYIGKKIGAELEYGRILSQTRDQVMRIVERMKEEDGIQAVVLGCTELPLLFEGAESPVKTIDVMKIHIETLIRMILEEQRIA